MQVKCIFLRILPIATCAHPHFIPGHFQISAYMSRVLLDIFCMVDVMLQRHRFRSAIQTLTLTITLTITLAYR